VCLILLVAVPAFFNLSVVQIFEEQKSLLLRAATPLLAIVTLSGAPWRSRAWRHPIAMAIAVFSCALAVAAVTSLAPYDSWFGAYYRRHGVATWAAGVAVFAAMAIHAQSAVSRERLSCALIAGSAWPSLYALIQAAGFDPVTWTETVPGRAGSTAGNALLFGGYLAAVIPLTAFESLRRNSAGGNRRDARRVLYPAILLLQTAALLATRSRAPLAATAAGTAVGLLVYVAPLRARAARILIATAVLAVAAITLVGLPSSFEGGSGRVRVLIWRASVSAMREARVRWLVGYGPETLRLIIPRYYDPEIGVIEQTDAMPDRAHNELADALVSSGIIGAAAELAFFAAVLVGAVRVREPAARAGLLGAAVAHMLEIQLGFATTMSRLAFLTVAALAIGWNVESSARPVDVRIRASVLWMLLGAGVIVGAASLVNIGTAAFYILAFAFAAGGAWMLSGVRRPLTEYVICLGAVAIAVAAAWPVALEASSADRYARLGRSLKAQKNWPAAVEAYRAAAAYAPREPQYLSELAGTLLEYGDESPPERARLFASAEAALARARQLNPYDPHQLRNLASVERRRARVSTDAADRARSLEHADDYYREATALAPRLQSLWIEWANVAAEQRRLDVALSHLDRAASLDDTNVDVWMLRALVSVGARRLDEALAAYDRALSLRPDAVAALRGRAAILAQQGRRGEALAAVDQLLAIAPADDMGRRIKQALASTGANQSAR
jgi:tetratricopeptide (TPR) repeat protein